MRIIEMFSFHEKGITHILTKLQSQAQSRISRSCTYIYGNQSANLWLESQLQKIVKTFTYTLAYI